MPPHDPIPDCAKGYGPLPIRGPRYVAPGDRDDPAGCITGDFGEEQGPEDLKALIKDDYKAGSGASAGPTRGTGAWAIALQTAQIARPTCLPPPLELHIGKRRQSATSASSNKCLTADSTNKRRAASAAYSNYAAGWTPKSRDTRAATWQPHRCGRRPSDMVVGVVGPNLPSSTLRNLVA